jgi:hypothetical protein
MKVIVVCGEGKPRQKTRELIKKLNGGNSSGVEYMSVGLNGKDCKADYTHPDWIDRCFPGTNTPFADVIVLEGCPQRHFGAWENPPSSVFQYSVIAPLVRRVLRPYGFLLVIPSPMAFLGTSSLYSTTLVHKNGRRTDLVEPDEAKYAAFFGTTGLKHEGEMHGASVFTKAS